MRLTIANSKIKKRNLVLINNDTHQRETLSERPIRPPLIFPFCVIAKMLYLTSAMFPKTFYRKKVKINN